MEFVELLNLLTEHCLLKIKLIVLLQKKNEL